MRNLPRALLLAAALGAPAALAPALPAQQDPTTQPPTEPRTLRFDGGTLVDLAAVLRQDGAARGQAVNIVLPADAARVQVPALTLTSASVGDTLRAVATVLMPDVQMSVADFQTNSEVAPVLAVALALREERAGPRPPIQLRVLSLATLTRSPVADDPTVISAETALTAVETALKLDTDEKADLRYHADSGLLFVRATPSQVALVDQVLDQLERDQTNLRRRTPPAMTQTSSGTTTTSGNPPPEPEPGSTTRRR